MTRTKPFTLPFPGPATIHYVQHGSSPEQVPALLVQTGGKALKLIAAERIPENAAVRIAIPGGTVLGDISLCAAENSSFAIYVRIEKVIPTVSDLGRLFAAVANPGVPAVKDVVSAEVLVQQAR